MTTLKVKQMSGYRLKFGFGYGNTIGKQRVPDLGLTWILADSTWDDTGYWEDNEFWNE